jgi:cytochrome c biogenesis protein
MLDDLASPRLTLILLLAFFVLVIAGLNGAMEMTWAIAGPLLLLALNLLAALASNAMFRNHIPLMVFHVCLLLLIVLAALGRLTYFKGGVEVAEGTEFDGHMIWSEAGLWHAGQWDRVRFINESFHIDYTPEVTIAATRNRVRYLDESGQWQAQEVTEQKPLRLHGYQLYVTTNKGFAPVFTWQPRDGSPPGAGAIHLSRFPQASRMQDALWVPPGTRTELFLQLHLDEPVLPEGRASRLQPPRNYRVTVDQGGVRHELKAGERLELPEGTLVLNELRMWMGYQVFYDWTVPWMLAVAVLAVLSLAWHFWGKFARQPWNA